MKALVVLIPPKEVTNYEILCIGHSQVGNVHMTSSTVLLEVCPRQCEM